VREMKSRMEAQQAEARASQAALTAELTRHMSDLKGMHERMLQLDADRQAERLRAAELEAEVVRLRTARSSVAPPPLGTFAGGLSAVATAESDAASAAPSPSAEAERRATRALEESQRLLDAAAASRRPTARGCCTEPTTEAAAAASRQPTAATPPRVSAPPTASRAPVPDVVGASNPWTAPRTKTVWGMMFGPESSSTAEGSPPPTRPPLSEYFIGH
jgi:hypothetical protein